MRPQAINAAASTLARAIDTTPSLAAGERFVDARWAAAVARVNGLVLVTTNTKDFLRVEDLEVEDGRAAARDNARRKDKRKPPGPARTPGFFDFLATLVTLAVFPAYQNCCASVDSSRASVDASPAEMTSAT
jgi:predicted nucleic acid-binding protein